MKCASHTNSRTVFSLRNTSKLIINTCHRWKTQSKDETTVLYSFIIFIFWNCTGVAALTNHRITIIINR